MKEREGNKYYHTIYPSETTVFDKTGKRIVACPTEDEAVEYIREMEEDRKGGRKNED